MPCFLHILDMPTTATKPPTLSDSPPTTDGMYLFICSCVWQNGVHWAQTEFPVVLL